MSTIPHKRKLGQYFTPAPVIAAAFEMLDEISGRNGRSVRVIDPACGEGAFLQYAIENGIALPLATLGIDRDYRFNSSINGDLKRSASFRILNQNGLLPIPGEKNGFDYVVGNPPYGTSILDESGAEEEALKHALKNGFQTWRNGYILNGNSSVDAEEKAYLRCLRSCPIEVVFLERFVQLASAANKPGFVAVVIPDGVLANARLIHVREWLTARVTINAVVSLPRKTFTGTGTTAKTSLMLMTATPPSVDHQVFLAEAEHLEQDLPIILSDYRTHCSKRQTKFDHSSVSLVNQSDTEFTFRMDASFWRPQILGLIQKLRNRFPTAKIGDLVDRRAAVITGDHVRRSRGEAKGYDLDSPFEYYETVGFIETGYETARIKRCTKNAFERLGYTAVKKNDILISCAGVGGVGRAKICFINHQPGQSCTGDVFILRLPNPLAEFVYLFMKSEFGRTQIARLSNGTGTLNINSDELLSVEIPLLDESIQRDLAAELIKVWRLHHDASHRRASLLKSGLDVECDNSYLQTMQQAATLQSRLVNNLELFLGNNQRQSKAIVL